LLVGLEGVFDEAGDLVGRAGEELDTLDRLVGVPAGEVGDALAARKVSRPAPAQTMQATLSTSSSASARLKRW
jgi:hypothetical protein